MLLTQRMEEFGLHPMGFVATEYATLIWGLDPVLDPAPLFKADNIRADFEIRLSGNAVMKKAFRGAATVAGLIERNLPQVSDRPRFRLTSSMTHCSNTTPAT